MKPIANRALFKLGAIVLAITLACSASAIIVIINIEKVDSIVGAIINWDGGSGTYLACYDDFLLTSTRDEFFQFSTGYGRNSVAKLRLRFPDGNVYEIDSLTPTIVSEYFPEKDIIARPGTGFEIESFSSGFDSIGFFESKVESVHLSEDSNIAIDFGDGQFVKLPVDREKLLKLLGPPNDWEKRKGGPP